VRHRVRTDNDLATHTAQRATDHPQLEALTEPQLSIATLRFTDNRIEDLDAFNHDVLIAVRRESRFTVSSTVVDGHYAIRPCYINPRTTVEHVDEFVDAVVSVGNRMLAG
jgi:aromatic-L-amino-acid decarboxylase